MSRREACKQAWVSTAPSVTGTSYTSYSSQLSGWVSVGLTLWFPSGHLPSQMTHWVRDTTPHEGWRVFPSRAAYIPLSPAPPYTKPPCADVLSRSCGVSSSCRKLWQISVQPLESSSQALLWVIKKWGLIKHGGDGGDGGLYIIIINMIIS